MKKTAKNVLPVYIYIGKFYIEKNSNSIKHRKLNPKEFIYN